MTILHAFDDPESIGHPPPADTPTVYRRNTYIYRTPAAFLLLIFLIFLSTARSDSLIHFCTWYTAVNVLWSRQSAEAWLAAAAGAASKS